MTGRGGARLQRMFEVIVVLLKRASGIIGWIDEDAFYRAGTTHERRGPRIGDVRWLRSCRRAPSFHRWSCILGPGCRSDSRRLESLQPIGDLGASGSRG